MEDKGKKAKKDEKSKKAQKKNPKKDEEKNIDNKIYFILCFHNDINEKNLISFQFKENEIEKIEYVYSYGQEIAPNYTPKIYCIYCKKDQKRPKAINLSISFDTFKFWEINEFNIKDKTKFIFLDIKPIDKHLYLFINYIMSQLNKKNINRNNFCLNLDIQQKLNIYKKFVEEIIINIPEKLDSNESLAYDFLKNKFKKLNFSSAVLLLSLSYNNKNIYSFLDISSKINYTKDEFKNEYFNELLNNYNTKKDVFFKYLKENKKDKKDDYEKLMNNFMNMYFLLYEKEKFINDKEIRTNSKKILIKMINDRDNLIETSKMINEYLMQLFLIYKENNDEKEKKKDNRIKIINNNINKINISFLEEFNNFYVNIVEFQKKNKVYFLDLSYIIEKLMKISTNLYLLKKLLEIFKYELNQIDNYNLHDKLNKNIDNFGNDLFRNGNFKNERILDFISFNEIYLSNKNNNKTNNLFIKKYNDDYKKRKKVDLLKGIDINSKEDPILYKIEKYETYKYFCFDMCGEYLSVFTNKISGLKNLGIFYILLPKSYYNHDSLIALKEWVFKNIGTFSIAECKTIKEDINIFFEILIKVANQYIDIVLKFLINNLGDFCMELFIYLLNNNKVLNTMIKKSLIQYYISSSSSSHKLNNNDLYNINEIIYFIEHLEADDNHTIELFLNEINNYIFNEKDFFCLEKSERYILFETLLKYKKKYILDRKGDYIINLKYISESLITKLKNSDVILYEVKPLFMDFKNNFLLERIRDLLYGQSKEEKIEDEVTNESFKIYDNIQKQIISIVKDLKKLSVVINYLDEFFSEKREKMNEKQNIVKFIAYIYEKKVCEISKSDEIKKKFSSFQILIKDAKKNIEIKTNSLLFMEIYKSNKNKIKDQIYLLEQTCEIFSLAIDIIKEEPEKIQNNKFIKYFYEIGYTNENNLDKEINWLIKYKNILISEEKKNKLLTSLKLLIKKQNIINIIKGIFILKDIYEDNLNQTDEEKFYFDELKAKLELLTQNISSNEIKEIINFIREKFKEITFDNSDRNYKNKILVFFNSFNNNKKSFYFFKEKKLENIRNLKEFLLDSDEKELTLYEIDEFFKVIRFLNDDISKLNSSFELIQTFISGILNKDKFECYLYIINKYNKLKSLFDKFLKGEGGVFSKIKDIMNYSSFWIDLLEDKSIYQIQGVYEKTINLYPDNKINYNSINSNEFDELYQKIFISRNTENMTYIKEYIMFYKEIKKLTNIINKLYLKYGYPNKIFIKFNIIKIDIQCIYDSRKYNPTDLIKLFKNIKKECKAISNKYIFSDEIRFFYGRQLYLINEHIIQNNYEKIKDLISCSTNGLIKKFTNNYNWSKSNPNIYERMIINIFSYIKYQLAFNEKKTEDIYLTNKILVNDNNQNIGKYNENNLFKGFYFYGYSVKENDIRDLYIDLTGNMPTNSNLLFCNNDTTFEEINVFFLRAIYCNINSLFTVVIPEFLNNNHKSYLINIVKKKSLKEAKMMRSCLVIFFCIKDSEFHQSIKKIKNIKFINFRKGNSNIKKSKDNITIKIINSKICGLGKSTYIKKNNDKNGQIIYLPIGGDMSKDELVDRIKASIPEKLNDSIKIILHIDLTQTNDKELVRDFLFKLLILKKCELNENVIYIKPNINIFIELENNFYSFLNTFKILNFFEDNIVQLKTIGKIELTKEVKLVSTILSNLENNKLLKNNIDLNNDYFDKKIDYQRIILKYLAIENPNYYQINTFTNVLSCEFEKFNSCLAFSPSFLEDNSKFMGMTKEEALELRELIISSLIKITKYFTEGPYDKLIKTQDETKKSLDYGDTDNNNSIMNLLEININNISYDDIKPSLIVFNNDGMSISILTTCSEKEEEFKKLEKLYNSQNTEYQRLRMFGNDGKKTISKLKNLRSLEDKEILNMIINFLDVKGLSAQELNKIIGNYVYTADNFIKVILVLLRIRAKLPVIMMGETGCGKTTLIEMAFKLINKDETTIKKLNIHSGINDKDIIDFIDKINKDVELEDKRLFDIKLNNFYNSEGRNLYDENNIKNKIKEEINSRKIWIFFDEINTCNSMGLLSEIFCKNTYRGKQMDKRYVFLAACNPYRLLLKERKMDSILIHKNSKTKKLVYCVNPLPHSLLNFVFHFGNLKTKDERKYIESMSKKTMKSIFINYKNNEEERILYEKLVNIQVECISIAQNFVKKNNDVSVVSLREVNRFLLFFKFFGDFIIKRNINDDNFNGNGFSLITDEIVSIYKNKTKLFYYQSAINISLFICYYLRLPDKKSRKELEEELNSKKFFESDFLKIPSLEMDYVINNFIIPIGIAKNQALKENLFTALFCVVNKIPLIICGKPGRSKTLCIQILQSSMKGKEGSKSYLCKLYPELITFKIQGALNTKTEDVVKVFDKARETQRENNNTDKIHLVLMDEMGLAELSPNNPLKVIHFELEKEENKVPFVGITNWGLDSSKMNRAIYIIVQEPDEDDLIITAREIVKSYDINKENYYDKFGSIFNYLSKAYYKFIEDKKMKNDENKFFHGSRDFYSLIKNVICDIIKNKNLLEEENANYNQALNKICMKNIERNFGGLDNSINEFKLYFNELYNVDKKYEYIKEYELLKCLKDSLYDKESRYLLMISDSSISRDILNSMLNEINNQIILDKKDINNCREEINIENLRKKEIIAFLGSKFKLDEKSIYYCDEILYKIKCQMETEHILILKDLEIVYPSLYELFNRSFIDLQGVKFARLGKSKSLSLVNDNFKVIVLVDKKNINKEDPPFLNRFEKHIISFSNILNHKLISLADEIYSVLKEISFDYDNNFNNDEIKINKKSGNDISLFLNKNIKHISNEEVRGLVYLASKKNIKEKNDIVKFILNKIVPTFTEDLMIILQKFGFKAKHNLYYENIINIYKNNYCYNLKNFIEKTDKKLSIIYTFSFINDSLFEIKNENIKNRFFNENISNKSIKEIKISDIDSINIVDKHIINYLTETEPNLFIIRFREKDLIKLDDVYNLVNGYIEKESDLNSIQEKENRTKLFIILIHISRVNEIYKSKNIKNKVYDNGNSYYISFLSETAQYFIDNLTNKYSYFLDILENTNEKIISNIINQNSLLSNQIVSSLRYFTYILFNQKSLLNNKKLLNLNLNENELKIKCLKEYRDRIIYNFVMNKNLYNYVFSGIISFFKTEKDFIKNIFSKNVIKKEDNDFLDTLNIYIEQQTRFYLIKLIYLYDQMQIFQSFLFNENIIKYKIINDELNNYIENIYNINTNKINLGGIKLNIKIERRLLLGIKIPFIQNIIKDNVFNYIKNNISKDFIQKENILMNKRISNEKLNNEKTRYLNEINHLNNKLKNELINCNFLMNILKSGEKQLIKDLFNNCFYVFLMKSNIFKDDYDLLIQILDIIIQIRFKTRMNDDLNIDFCFDLNKETIDLAPSFLDLFNQKIEDNNIINKEEENNYINQNIEEDKDKDCENYFLNIFVNTLIFIESYSKEIYNILELFYLLNKNIEIIDFSLEIKSAIIYKKIQIEISERNPEYSQINKICFFFIIESLLKQIVKNLKNKNFYYIYNYFKKIKCSIINILKIEKKLLLFSKTLFTFEIILKILDYYEKQNNENKEEIYNFHYESVLQNIFEAEDLFISKNYDELVNNINNINNNLKEIFEENSDKYAELMILIIINRYKMINNNNYRENLVKLLIQRNLEISNNKLIKYSYPLLSLILSKCEPEVYKDEENIDRYKDKFLNFVSNYNDKNYSLKLILNTDHPELNEVILYYFENSCQNYFYKIKEEEKKNKKLCQKLCGGMSKIYLNLAINFINSGKSNKNILYNLGKLYSIAYIKVYLSYYVKIIMDNNIQNLDERKEINKILFSEETKISKEIKYYTLKLCLDRKKNNYEEFLLFFKNDNLFEFKEYFNKINLNIEEIFFYSLLPALKNSENNTLLDFKIYKDFYNDISSNRTNLSLPKEMRKFKINDIIYTYLYYNFYKSYLSGNQNPQIKANLINLISGKSNKEEEEFKKLIFNDNPFNTKILPKLGIISLNENKKINKSKIEILFYAFRFVFSILYEGNSNNFFYQLLTENAINTINDNMIPGKLSNTNDFIKSFDIINQNFKKDPNYSAYLCSCGYHYTIDNCSFPTKEFFCPKCNQIIGGINHYLHRREGHKRIFYNNQHKEKLLSLFYADKTIPYILLKDLEKEVNNKKNELFKGLKKESKEYFLKRRAKIRQINYITFRILNFILHGFILYSNCREYIPNEYLNNNLIESMTCFEIIEKDWEIINTELKIKQVPNIQIFLNVIFDKILSLMKQQKNFNNDNKLNTFEKETEKIINESINNKEIICEYIKNNNIMIDNIGISDKLIILENEIFNLNFEKEYPDMKYFKKSKLPKIKDFKKEFNSLDENSDNYPLINYILDENSNIKYLKYLPLINSLCNKMINYCSYRYSREEAKKIDIRLEFPNLIEQINKFIEIYHTLRPLLKQIDCRQLHDMKGNLYFNDLINEPYLSNFCVDLGEFNYGYVLTGIYKEMINWQNQFINVVLNSKNNNNKNYSELFEQEIMIQDSTDNDIIKYPPIKEIMNDIITKNSFPKNYGVIYYNYELIEEELASIILPSIKKFVSDNENCLKYVIYQYEGFRGNKSNIITRFIEKYKTKALNNDELRLIYNLKNKYEKNNKKNINFLFSLQILIDIILENNYDKNELISNVIEQNNQNENIGILKELFDNTKERKLFTIDSLMNIFNIFEIICWEKIKDNLSESYLMEINEDIKNYINNSFNILANKQSLISKVKLATAIRRFVSRYLSGRRAENEIDEKNKLILYLSKQELWDEFGLVDNEEFQNELNMIFSEEGNNFNILVGQATNLYEILGGDISLMHEYFISLEVNKQRKKINNNIVEEKNEIKEENFEEKINKDEREDDIEDEEEKSEDSEDEDDKEITY